MRSDIGSSGTFAGLGAKPEPLHASSRFSDARHLILEITGPSAADLEAWVSANVAWIEQQLHQHGALLFRGGQIDTPEKLARFAAFLANDFPTFKEESSPRLHMGGTVFSSTEYPKEYPIQLHCEYSYAAEWPMKLFFGCVRPPASGGETPVASTRAVLQRLRASTKAAFRERQIMYVRNYRQGLGVSWQDAFGSNDRGHVERHCANAGIHVEWLPGNALRTRQVGAAILRHPQTGQEVWFNHAFFFNVGSLEPRELREFFLDDEEDALATQTFFGDGTRIPDDIIEELREAFNEKTSCTWRRGDVLLVDNMLTAHGREPFSGPRSIAVVMAEKCSRKDLIAAEVAAT